MQAPNVLARARRQSPRSRQNAWTAGRKTSGTTQKRAPTEHKHKNINDEKKRL